MASWAGGRVYWLLAGALEAETTPIHQALANSTPLQTLGARYCD